MSDSEQKAKRKRSISATSNVASKVELGSFDYLIVACGYTGRLLRYFVDLGAEFIKTDSDKSIVDLALAKACDKTTFKRYDTSFRAMLKAHKFDAVDYDGESPPIPLYINDQPDVFSLIKDPTPEYPADELSGCPERKNADAKTLGQEIQTVLDCDRDEYGGTIAFRYENLSEAFRLTRYLTQLHHCACFSNEPYDMTLVNAQERKTCVGYEI